MAVGMDGRESSEKSTYFSKFMITYRAVVLCQAFELSTTERELQVKDEANRGRHDLAQICSWLQAKLWRF